jgi:hypothetical protein
VCDGERRRQPAAAARRDEGDKDHCAHGDAFGNAFPSPPVGESRTPDGVDLTRRRRKDSEALSDQMSVFRNMEADADLGLLREVRKDSTLWCRGGVNEWQRGRGSGQG